ncbi:hypothetical protein PoHVEF18_009129 [Penicillium ochrochloron]
METQMAKGNPPRSQIQEAIAKSRKIMSAIYWDLNAMWHLQQIVAAEPSLEEVELYEMHRAAVRTFLDHAVCYKYAHIFQPTEPFPNVNRSRNWLFQHGWVLFTMCAHSEAFRTTYLEETTFIWDELRKLISANQRSIDVFVRSRDIDWRGPLLTYGQFDLPGILEALGPKLNIGTEHPHHVVQTLDGFLKRPIHAGKAQTNINGLVLKPRPKKQKHPLLRPKTTGPCMGCLCNKNCACHELGGTPDCRDCRCPKVCKCKEPYWVTCFNCGSPKICDCRIESMAGDLIELVEYPTKGTGVRALSHFKAGTIMGEYVGEVLPISWACTDDIYSLAQSGLLSISGTGIPTPGPLAHTTSAHLGNWTRYINHHCDPNCYLESIMIGDRVTTIVKACRDISIFDEITVHYGPGYWISRYCLCGSPKCCQPPPKSM